MAKYSLSDCYNEAERSDYTLNDLDCYWRTLHSEEREKDFVRYAHSKLISFLEVHGKTQAKTVKDAVDGHLKVQLTHKAQPLSHGEVEEDSFSYLQLLCYVMDKSNQHTLSVGKFLDLIDHPSQVSIPLYKEILDDLENMISEDVREQTRELDRRAEVVWTSYELTSLIAELSFCDYMNTSEQLDPTGFIKQSKERVFPYFHGLRFRLEKRYFDVFYSIVAFARTSAEIVDMLHAFKKVKNEFAIGHSDNPEYERMIRPECRKVCDSDRTALAYQNGKIIEVLSDQVELLNFQPSDECYLAALKKYVEAHLQELVVKVFCLDNPKDIGKERMKQYKRMLKRNFERVSGFKVFETDRYKTRTVLSKAKLISLYQVILLSKPQTHFTSGRDHVTKTRPERTNGMALRETKSYHSVFLESPGRPTYRDSYSQQELCIWVYYQTLKNIVSDRWAENYLDVNIAALEAILDEADILTASSVQKRAEQILRMAVIGLIRKENDDAETSALYQSLQSELGEDTALFSSGTFRRKANLYRLGAFIRLFSVEEVKKRIVGYIHEHCEDDKGSASVVIDPYYSDINRLPPLSINIIWDREPENFSLVLNDITGFCEFDDF